MNKYEVKYNERGIITNPELLKENQWLMFLAVTSNQFYNPERLTRIADKTGHEVLDYTLKTLDLFYKYNPSCFYNSHFDNIRYYVEQTLKWSEVSKCGSEHHRKIWREKGFNLDAHNEASADIYLMYSTDNAINTEIIYRLIKTHGLVGQYLRGEVSLSDNYLLTDMVDRNIMTYQQLNETLYILNYCIIAGVSEELFNSLKDDIKTTVENITAGRFKGKTVEKTKERLQRMLPESFKDVSTLTQDDILFYSDIFKIYKMWYVNAAIGSFTAEEVTTIFSIITHTKGMNVVDNISFKPLLDSLFYDYNGKKKLNVYKKRVIEAYLKNLSNEHVDLMVTVEDKMALVDFVYTPACEKLIDFCVEAERANIVTYSESITMLFTKFGFRRDSLDRLNNEDSYLDTMNDAEKSTKVEIPEYVSGDYLVDVGSGGGIMLDSLEKIFPDKKIIGTDISTNVIETLNQKKTKEGHNWDVVVHNFVDGEFEDEVTTVIFSSILHEVFSFSEINGKRFNVESVKTALRNAYESIPYGGRIIIRDGVKTDSDKVVTLKFIAPDIHDFFVRYLENFKGLPEVNRADIVINDDSATAPINYIREFLFTYTWGAESFPFEVEEQFGYMTLNEYKDFIKDDLRGNIVRAEEFLEPGYTEHLSGKYELYEGNEHIESLPNSNLFIVIQK